MWLVIDTAGPVCAVGLFDGTTAVAEASENIGRGHAERLMPMVEAVVADAAWRDVSAVVVTRGPGAFTGLRVGLSAARGFGLALGVPVYGVSVLDALAYDRGAGQPFTLALKAGRGEVWCGTYDRTRSPVGAPWSALETDVKPPAGFETIVAAPNGSATLASIVTVALDQPMPGAPPSALYLRAPDAKPQMSPLPATQVV